MSEIEKDLEEFRKFASEATRENVKYLLNQEVQRIEKLLKAQSQESVRSHAPAYRPVTQIRTYAWDQSPKFIKFYITLKEAENANPDNVEMSVQSRSFRLCVKNMQGSDHELTISGLLHEVSPSQSQYKLKKDTVLVMLKKVNEGQNWGYITQQEEKMKEKKSKPLKPDDAGDPSAGIMSLMKQMYDDGDDEMKRTIKKAWCEAQDKKQMNKLEEGMGGIDDDMP